MKGNNDSISLEVNTKKNTEKKKGRLPRKNLFDNINDSNLINKNEKLSNDKNQNEPYDKGIFLDIQGLIKEGTFQEDDEIFCKYDIVYDKEWQVTSGQNSGQSQHACLGDGTVGYFVWNMPFQLRLNTNQPLNWPQLIISCYCPDFLGREVLKGYGTCYIPTTPGIHERTLSMFCPLSSYSFKDILELFYGEKAELINAPKILAMGAGREILRTKSVGSIKIKFTIQIENLEENGYEV